MWAENINMLKNLNIYLNRFHTVFPKSFSGLPISSRRMMSSLRLVPPVVAMTFTPPICLLMSIHIWLICRANSRVGTITMAKKVSVYEKVLLLHNAIIQLQTVEPVYKLALTFYINKNTFAQFYKSSYLEYDPFLSQSSPGEG